MNPSRGGSSSRRGRSRFTHETATRYGGGRGGKSPAAAPAATAGGGGGAEERGKRHARREGG